jgi:hypothetical protein
MSLFAFLLLTPAAPAFACGVSGPDGVWSCSVAEHEEEERPRWSVGAAGGATWTQLRFGHLPRAKETRNAVLATASYAPTSALRILVSAGATISGQLHMPDGRHDFAPGPSGAVGVSYRLLSGMPFLALSAVVSGSTAQTHLHAQPNESTRYTAF